MQASWTAPRAVVVLFFSILIMPAHTQDPPDMSETLAVAPGQSIQDAIDRLAEANGGTVRLDAGVYTLRQSLWLHSHIVLQGSGPATVLKAGEGLSEVALGTRHDAIEHVTLRDFSLVGPGEPDDMREKRDDETAAAGIMGIFMAFATDKGRHVRLQRLRITRWTRMGVHLKGITGLHIEGCDIDCSSAYNSLYHNVYLRRTHDVHVHRNLFRNSPVGNGFQASFSERIVIENNHSTDNAGHGIRVAASDDIIIRNNTVVRNGGQAGIWLNSEKGRPCRDVTVSRNTVYHNAHSGLAVRNTYHCGVDDNDIRDNGVDISFRNARETVLRRNRFLTTTEEKTNSLSFEDNIPTEP